MDDLSSDSLIGIVSFLHTFQYVHLLLLYIRATCDQVLQEETTTLLCSALLCSGRILCLSRFLQVWLPDQYTPVSSHCNQNKLKIICKRLFISSISDTGWYECYSTSYRKSLDIWLGSNIKWFNSVHPLENTVKIRKTLLLKWEIVSQDKCRKPFHLAV